MPLKVNAGLALRQVGLTQPLHFRDNTFLLVCARSHTSRLKEGMDLAFEEFSVLVDADLNDRGIAGDTSQTDVVGGTEVP